MNKERISVLMLSTDVKLFDKNSVVSLRLAEYSKYFNDFRIVVLGSKTPFITDERNRYTIYSTSSFVKIMRIFDAVRIGGNLIRNLKTANGFVVTCENPFETGVVGFYLKWRYGIALHVQVHTDFMSEYYTRGSRLNFLRRFVARFVLHRADRIRVVSQSIKSSLVLNKIAEDRGVDVLPIFVRSTSREVETSRNASTENNGVVKLLSVGRLTREKNYSEAIFVVKQLLDKGLNIQYTIIGNGPLVDRLRKEAGAYLNSKIFISGWDDCVSAYYNTADIFLHTSFYEGYGLVLVEAAFAGLVIVSTRVGVASQLIQDGENSFLYDVGDTDNLQQVLTALINSKDRKKLGEKLQNSQLLLDMNNEEEYYSNFAKTIEDALESKNVSGGYGKKILIVTQIMDEEDPVLGFFHNWVRFLSYEFEKIEVVCLRMGKIDLPKNVTVHSLGKENGQHSKLVYCIRFFKILYRLRFSYSDVFVHMNIEYVLLAGLYWKIRKNKMVLWYNHSFGSVFAKISMQIVDIVCHTSPYSFTAGTEKSLQMPAGIDTDKFVEKNDISRDRSSILYVGRISSVKNVDTLIDACGILQKKGVEFQLTILGPKDDPAYFTMLDRKVVSLGISGHVSWFDTVTQKELPKVYSAHAITVNLTPSGNFDKTVLESAVCGSISIASSPAFSKMIPSEYVFRERDSVSLSLVLEKLLSLDESERDEIIKVESEYVKNNQSLRSLAKNIKNLYIR